MKTFFSSGVFLFFMGMLFGFSSCEEKKETASCWPAEKIKAWEMEHGWLVGCNYIPSTAINQLEMWQPETFDTTIIDSELQLAEDIGFNVIRVFLHDLMWDKDSASFLARMDKFLSIASTHHIKVMFVFFDDCWYGNPQRGKQPDPVPGLHNSGWLQSPSYAAVMNPEEWPRLERYLKGVLRHFRNDNRIALWDLYNEPANNHYPSQIFPLVKKVFRWAREINPSQPLTVCKWKNDPSMADLTEFCIAHSDVITFHNYGPYESMAKEIANLKSYGKPVVCSEYLARGFQSTFETILPLLKKEKTGAINWGFVEGKTQTKYPWNHPLNVVEVEPWHHDIFRSDRTPYRQEEVQFIRQTIKGPEQ